MKKVLQHKETGKRMLVEAVDAKEILPHGEYVEIGQAQYGHEGWRVVAPLEGEVMVPHAVGQGDTPPGAAPALVKNEEDAVRDMQTKVAADDEAAGRPKQPMAQGEDRGVTTGHIPGTTAMTTDVAERLARESREKAAKEEADAKAREEEDLAQASLAGRVSVRKK